MNKYTITLTKEERDNLLDISRKGVHRSQKVLNALILLGCDKGDAQDSPQINEKISDVLKVSMRKLDCVVSAETGALPGFLSGYGRLHPRSYSALRAGVF